MIKIGIETVRRIGIIETLKIVETGAGGSHIHTGTKQT